MKSPFSKWIIDKKSIIDKSNENIQLLTYDIMYSGIRKIKNTTRGGKEASFVIFCPLEILIYPLPQIFCSREVPNSPTYSRAAFVHKWPTFELKLGTLIEWYAGSLWRNEIRLEATSRAGKLTGSSPIFPKSPDIWMLSCKTFDDKSSSARIRNSSNKWKYFTSYSEIWYN